MSPPILFLKYRPVTRGVAASPPRLSRCRTKLMFWFTTAIWRGVTPEIDNWSLFTFTVISICQVPGLSMQLIFKTSLTLAKLIFFFSKKSSFWWNIKVLLQCQRITFVHHQSALLSVVIVNGLVLINIPSILFSTLYDHTQSSVH